MTDYTLKRCSKCGLEKPATTEYFQPHKAYSGGLRPQCRNCANEYTRTRWQKNADKINARRNERYNNDPNVIAAREKRAAEQATRLPFDERRKIARKKWRDNNHEYARRMEEDWKKRNPEKVRAYSTSDKAHERVKRWTKNNPHKRRAIVARYIQNNPAIAIVRFHRRRARVRNLPDTLTADEWQRCLEYFDYRCAICDKPAGLWHIIAADHWIPVNHPDCPGTVALNMIPLCHAVKDGEGGCNNLKRDKDPVTWLVERFGKKKSEKILKRIQDYFDRLRGGA